MGKKPSKYKDLTGQIFGRLTVTERISNIKGRVAFRCVCECGETRDVLAGSLRSGATKSCGCLHIELAGKDLTRNQYGFWLVLSVSKKRSANGYRYWLCRCDCGIEREVSGESLLAGKSRSCGGCTKAKQFCLRGHDTHIWGRSDSGACKACVRDKHLRSNYGISIEDFNKLYEAQGGKCAICGKELGAYKPLESGFGKGSRIEVDHDHKIKNKRLSVRGLLCGGRWAGCNRRIGRLDKIDWLKQVVAYLENPPAKKALIGKI